MGDTKMSNNPVLTAQAETNVYINTGGAVVIEQGEQHIIIQPIGIAQIIRALERAAGEIYANHKVAEPQRYERMLREWCDKHPDANAKQLMEAARSIAILCGVA